MSDTLPSSTALLWTKLAIALLSFLMLAVLAWVHVVTQSTVEPWLFALFVAILGAMLGVDILADKRSRLK